MSAVEVIDIDAVNRQFYQEELGASGNNLIQKPTSRIRHLCQYFCTKLCVSLIIAGIISIVIICVALLISYEKDSAVTLTIDVFKEDLSPEQTVWFNEGLEDLKVALNVPINTRRAKNVILFIADGFDSASISLARTSKYGANGALSWELFPHMGLLKSHKNNSAGTAFFGGVRASAQTAGVDSAVSPGDCGMSLANTHHVNSFLQWAQEAKLATGLVTNGDIRGSTSTALFAHVANVSWICDASLPEEVRSLGCLDIESQLTMQEPGKSINVLMGMQSPLSIGNLCVSEDYAPPFQTPIEPDRDDNYRIIREMSDFRFIDEHTEFVRAIFTHSMKTFLSLEKMVAESLKVLSNLQEGFVLVVICKQSNESHFADIIELDNAVKTAMKVLRDALDQTLLVVASNPFTSNEKREILDTAVHAAGPMAHLFHKLHNQTYIAHVVSYAARLGRFRDSMLASSLLQWF